MKSIKAAMHKNQEGRYTGEVLNLLSKAVILDPRHKNLPFLSSVEKGQLSEAIVTEAIQFIDKSVGTSSSTKALESKPPPKKNARERKGFLTCLTRNIEARFICTLQ